MSTLDLNALENVINLVAEDIREELRITRTEITQGLPSWELYNRYVGKLEGLEKAEESLRNVYEKLKKERD